MRPDRRIWHGSSPGDFVYGIGKETAADGTLNSSPLQSKTPTTRTDREPESPQTELAWLRAMVAGLEVEQARLTTERQIHCWAAKYFAGETRW
jgi:transposase